MQTFLPYKDFDQCAETLDNKRLNKQILESYQILKVLSNQSPSETLYFPFFYFVFMGVATPYILLLFSAFFIKFFHLFILLNHITFMDGI